MTAKPCWLSHGSPAITALSDEEADGTVEEVENEEYSTEQESSQSQRMESSLASPTRLCSPSPARVSQLISAMCQIEDMSQKNQTCENTSMLYSKGLLNMRGVAIPQQAWCLIISLFQHKDCHTRRAGQCPHHHMDISNPNPPFETPRTTMLSVAELDDEGDFDGVFTNYGNPSH